MERESIIEAVMREIAEYVENKYRNDRVKFARYPGGDYFIFSDLNKVFTRAPGVKVFVEVFGGSCWSSLNVPRWKFKVIVCNDIDADLINLYRMVKNSPDELVKKLSILPFSRELREIALEILGDKNTDLVTKSVMLFYALRASFHGFLTKRDGLAVSKTRSLAHAYSTAVASIAEYAKKFRDVVLECKDYRDVIKLYDSDTTLFYLDPPHVSTSQTHDREGFYRYNFTLSNLKLMARTLRDVRGKWVLKITRDNYELIRNDLPKHNKVELEKTKSMVKVEDEERPKYTLILAFNY